MKLALSAGLIRDRSAQGGGFMVSLSLVARGPSFPFHSVTVSLQQDSQKGLCRGDGADGHQLQQQLGSPQAGSHECGLDPVQLNQNCPPSEVCPGSLHVHRVGWGPCPGFCYCSNTLHKAALMPWQEWCQLPCQEGAWWWLCSLVASSRGKPSGL